MYLYILFMCDDAQISRWVTKRVIFGGRGRYRPNDGKEDVITIIICGGGGRWYEWVTADKL